MRSNRFNIDLMETLTFSVNSFSGDASLQASMHRAQQVEEKSVPGFDCTFEEDFCGWTQPGFVTTSWLREQASNRPSNITGPTSDHTFGNSSGFYAIGKGSPLSISSGSYERLILDSPRLPDNATGPMCFSWWYMMHETHDVKLTVSWIKNESNAGSGIEMWQRKGNYGRRWLFAQLQMDPMDNITSVRYEIFGLANARSAVSIDDIQLTESPCAESTIKSIACTFEDENICGYSSDEAADFSWSRARGADLTLVERPSEGKNRRLCILYS